jgi:hypothetical protein
MNTTIMAQCDACGSPNSDLNRFCGLCGHVLARVPVAVRSEAKRPQLAYVSGPSLLGLDAASQADDDITYLLDDEPRSHRGGFMLLFLVFLLSISAAAYFAYQRYFAVEPFSGRASQAIAPTFAYEHTPAAVLEQSNLSLNSEPVLPNRSLSDRLALDNISTTMRDINAVDKAADKSAQLVAEGEKYLFGRGVVSNCKAAQQSFEGAAKQGNAAAMAHLGSMYASGRCAKFNRVVAYQWFTKAKDADPSNIWIESSMDMLWRNMSSKERAAILK